MAYVFETPQLGMPPITSTILATQTTAPKPWKLGDICRAVDPTYGPGEFIYLLGVANTVVGSPVSWSLATRQTVLAAVGTNLPQGLGFAMSINLAGYCGWYQIGGIAFAKKAVGISLAAGVAVGVKTTGLVASTGTGKEILGALVSVVASAKSDVSTVRLVIDRPRYQGRVT